MVKRIDDIVKDKKIIEKGNLGFAIKYISENKLEEAKHYFKLSLSEDNNAVNKMLGLLYGAIAAQDDIRINNILNLLLSIDDKNLIADCYLFMYLLNLNGNLSHKLCLKLTDIKFESVQLSEKSDNYLDIDFQNELRFLIMNGDFQEALTKFKSAVKKDGYSSFNEDCLKRLLQLVVEKEQMVKLKIIKMINSKEYYELIKYLEKLEYRKDIIKYYDLILNLVKNIFYIKNF